MLTLVYVIHEEFYHGIVSDNNRFVIHIAGDDMICVYVFRVAKWTNIANVSEI